MAWFKRFVDPIILPDGRKLLTLRAADEYITALPKAEHDAVEWQIAQRPGNAGAHRGHEGIEPGQRENDASTATLYCTLIDRNTPQLFNVSTTSR